LLSVRHYSMKPHALFFSGHYHLEPDMAAFSLPKTIIDVP
jgi:hypothetical protein